MNRTRTMTYLGGPKPRTPRGRRRHDKREPKQQKHAQKVWDGGYSIAITVVDSGGNA